jgi:parallel beta-helix repeat protein
MACVALTGALASADAATAAPEPPSQQGGDRPAPIEPTGRRASMAAMQSGRLGCGTVITRSTTLTADVGPCQGNGIIIGSDNIRLNLNGHTVFGFPGPGSGNDGGIRLPNRTGVTVTGQPGRSGRMGTVSGFDGGVVVNGGSGNIIENLHVRDNVGSDVMSLGSEEQPDAFLGDGIVLLKSSSNRVVNNLVTNNGIYDGIGVYGLGANFNLVQGNTVTDTVGVFMNRSAGGAGILINHFFDQPVGTDELITGNEVIGNTSRANDGSGISLVGTLDGQIVGNVAEYNGLRYAASATFENNAFDLSANGIGVQAAVGRSGTETNLLIRNNVANHNGLSGIFVHAFNNRVENNQAFRNGAIGIFVRSGSQGSSVSYNDTGFNYILDLYDEIGANFAFAGEDYCPNEWFGNTWGALQPGSQEWDGIPYKPVAAYEPDCAALGGSGPGPVGPRDITPPPPGPVVGF